MNQKIIILNDPARKNGNPAYLVDAFIKVAKSAGNQGKTFYLKGMKMHSGKGYLPPSQDSTYSQRMNLC